LEFGRLGRRQKGIMKVSTGAGSSVGRISFVVNVERLILRMWRALDRSPCLSGQCGALASGGEFKSHC